MNTTKNNNPNRIKATLMFASVTRKNRQMSIKVAQNDVTRKMTDFDAFTKICLRMWEIWAN